MKSLVMLALIFCLPLIVFAQPLKKTADPRERGYKDSDFPRIQKIAPNVYTYEALVGTTDRYTTNSMFVVTTDGVLVADGQGNPAETSRMVDEITKIANRPIKYVVISSDHGDHTNGNVSFPESAEFIAHPNSKANLQRTANAPNRRPDAPKIVLPSALVADKRVLKMGGTEIQILFLGRAHTGGDLVVYLPKERILFMTEVYLNRLFPGMRSAYPSEWMSVFAKAEQIRPDWFIPGHGFVDDPKTLKEELAAYKKATAHVIDEAKRLHRAGVPVEDAVKQARWGEYASWSGAASQGPIAIRRVYDELDGKLK